MKLVVGLGNPGKRYIATRHNVGFEVINKLGRELSAPEFGEESKLKSLLAKTTVAGLEVILAKPQTYMNFSGEAVTAIANYYKIQPKDIIVIHDDLDIVLGEYKFQLGKGPKQHNGIASIEEKLGTKDFWRLRMGVENRETFGRSHLGKLRTSGEEYVLQTFPSDELVTVHRTAQQVVTDLVKLLSEQSSTSHG